MNQLITPTKPVVGPNAVPVLRQFLSDRPVKKFVALVDENTHDNCLGPLITEVPELTGIDVLEIVASEDSKDLEIAQSIWEGMVELKVDRHALMVNLGGGVVTDLGGFVAGCFKRGIDFINVPTSLLGMVDASLGGKTGVNIDHLKNQIGLFINPVGIYIDPRFLSTLPERHYRSGLAEMLKHGLIRSEAHWEALGNANLFDALDVGDLLVDSIAIKQAVVEEDPMEKGLRKVLNYGHTIGHAVEGLYMTADEPLLHGEAVAVGLIAEAWLSHKLCGLPLADAEQIAKRVSSVFDAVAVPASELDYLQKLINHDKKNAGGSVRYALLERIGQATYDVEVPNEMLAEALDFYRASSK